MITLHSFVGVDPDVTNASLFRKLLAYYRGIEIDRIVLDLHSNSNNTARLELFSSIAREFQAEVRGIVTAPYSSHLVHTPHMNSFVREYGNERDWCLLVDGDEFVRFPGRPAEFLSRCTERGDNVVVGNFVDRLSVDSPFPQINDEDRLDTLFPYSYPATRQIRGGWDRKIVALRGKFLSIDGPFYDGRHALDQRRGYATATREARMLKLTDRVRSKNLRELARILFYRMEPKLPGVRPYPERLEVHHFAWDSVLMNKVKARLRNDEKNTHPVEFTRVMCFIEAVPPTRMLKPYLLERATLGV